MSDVVIDIASQAKKVKRDIDDLNKRIDTLGKETKDYNRQADRASKSTNQFAGALRAAGAAAAAFAAVQIAKDVIRFSDAIIRSSDNLELLEIRLENLTGSTGAFADALEVARENGIGIESVADIMARIALSTRDLGLQSAQVAEITNTIIQLGRLGGATLQELTGSTIQFAQALGSGVLQGDELRSILESNAPLARALADEFGVTIGEFRRLGSEGQITSERLVAALQNIGKTIEEDVANLPQTYAQALENLRTSLTVFGRELDEATGFGDAVTAGIDAATEAVERLTESLLISQGRLDEVSMDRLKEELRESEVALQRVVTQTRRGRDELQELIDLVLTNPGDDTLFDQLSVKAQRAITPVIELRKQIGILIAAATQDAYEEAAGGRVPIVPPPPIVIEEPTITRGGGGGGGGGRSQLDRERDDFLNFVQRLEDDTLNIQRSRLTDYERILVEHQDKVQRLEQAKRDGIIQSEEEIARAREAIQQNSFAKQEALIREISSAYQTQLASGILDLSRAFGDSEKSAKDAVVSMLTGFADLAAQQLINIALQKLFNQLLGAGSGLGGALGSIFGAGTSGIAPGGAAPASTSGVGVLNATGGTAPVTRAPGASQRASATARPSVSVVVNNNVPGAVVEQTLKDEDILEIAVREATTASELSFQQSLQSGYGGWNDTLSSRTTARRRTR